MSTLRDRAAQIKLGQQAEQLVIKSAEEKEVVDFCEKIKLSFERTFAAELALLQEEEITYSAHLVDNRYEHLGYYIRFTRAGKSLHMDYCLQTTRGGAGWRYEHTIRDRHPRACYDQWPKDEFITWIADFFFPENPYSNS